MHIVPVSAVRDGSVKDDLRYGEHVLYRLLNHRAEVIYVGVTGSPRTRWQAHLRRQPWARNIAEIYYIDGLTWHQALDLEREAILDERPIYNRTVKHEDPID